MAINKNITMKQYNGTDYDTLYPKTIAEQVDGVYSKEQVLKDATAALFGLTSSAVPDDIFAAIGKYKQYWWRRRTRTENGIWEKVEDSFSYGTERVIIASESSDVQNTVNVSEEITIDQSNGTISLSNPTSFQMAPNITGLNLASSNLPGKYFVNTNISERSSNAKYPWIEKNGVYFLQSSLASNKFKQNVEVGAEVITIVSSVYIYKISSKFTLQSITYGDWQYLQSSNRSAYPDSGTQDGYEYEYLGVPFDNAVTAPKIETGSYIGTGTYGQANPNTLTFGFAPKLVVIKPDLKTSCYHMEIIYGQGQTYTYMNNSNYGNVEISWSGNTVSWVCTSNSYAPASGQMNEANKVYYYIAIG